MERSKKYYAAISLLLCSCGFVEEIPQEKSISSSPPLFHKESFVSSPAEEDKKSNQPKKEKGKKPSKEELEEIRKKLEDMEKDLDKAKKKVKDLENKQKPKK